MTDKAPLVASSNPLEQFAVANRLAAFCDRNNLAKLCQINRFWQQVAQRELNQRRCCPVAKRGLLMYEWQTNQQQANGDRRQRDLGNIESAKQFQLLLRQLRTDWHSPYRLLIFCDTDFISVNPQRIDGSHLASPPVKRSKRKQTALHELLAYAAAELPPGGRLYLAVSLAGAIGTPDGEGAAPVEMETSRSSDARQMQGLAHVRLYSYPGDPRQFGVVSAGEPLPEGATPKLLLALPSNAKRKFGHSQPESQLLAAYPNLIVCSGLCHAFHSVTKVADNECALAAGVDHSRLVFYGDRLRVLSAMVKDDKDLERTLLSLKTSDLRPLQPGRCLAFMFICCAKGSKHYGDAPDVETGAFQRVLPGVPVLGLFSQGEFSRNCSPGERFAVANDESPLSLIGYRTSLCVLSWS